MVILFNFSALLFQIREWLFIHASTRSENDFHDIINHI